MDKTNGYYSYLMINNVDPDQQKLTTKIEISHNPLFHIYRFNKSKLKLRKKKEQIYKPWIIKMVVGTFETRDEAKDFNQKWKKRVVEYFQEKQEVFI